MSGIKNALMDTKKQRFARVNLKEKSHTTEELEFFARKHVMSITKQIFLVDAASARVIIASLETVNVSGKNPDIPCANRTKAKKNGNAVLQKGSASHPRKT